MSHYNWVNFKSSINQIIILVSFFFKKLTSNPTAAKEIFMLISCWPYWASVSTIICTHSKGKLLKNSLMINLTTVNAWSTKSAFALKIRFWMEIMNFKSKLTCFSTQQPMSQSERLVAITENGIDICLIAKYASNRPIVLNEHRQTLHHSLKSTVSRPIARISGNFIGLIKLLDFAMF